VVAPTAGVDLRTHGADGERRGVVVPAAVVAALPDLRTRRGVIRDRRVVHRVVAGPAVLRSGHEHGRAVGTHAERGGVVVVPAVETVRPELRAGRAVVGDGQVVPISAGALAR